MRKVTSTFRTVEPRAMDDLRLTPGVLFVVKGPHPLGDRFVNILVLGQLRTVRLNHMLAFSDLV
jgi:hypothetical protein